MISFSVSTELGERYGYIDMTGNKVVPAKYHYVGPFKSGKAWVQSGDNKYELINMVGKVLATSNDTMYGNPTNEIIPYLDEKTQKRGYKTLDGRVILKPVFTEAEEFIEGRAIVSVNLGKYNIKQGLIDSKGKYIVKPIYSSIASIGEGRYAVNNEAFSNAFYAMYPSFIMDSNGNKLSNATYLGLERFVGEYASASNGTETFFIDKNANRVSTLPTVKGVGTLKLMGDFVSADLDHSLSYYRRDGSLIWRQDDTQYMQEDIVIKREVNRPDYYTLIEYPLVSGIKDSKVEAIINKKLKDLFIPKTNPGASADEMEGYIETVDISFHAEVNKDLLIIEKSGYYYPIGAAHGTPSDDYFFFDLQNGTQYTLKNLFKKDAKYLERLTTLIRNQIDLNLKINDPDLQAYYFDSKPVITGDIGFTVKRDCLQIYFEPYEIASYAAGFVTFDIPYGQLKDFIDFKAPFWNAFEKSVVNSKTKILTDLNGEIMTSIKNQIKAYQKSKKDILSYEVYAIGYSNIDKVYKAYIIETQNILNSKTKKYTKKVVKLCYWITYNEETVESKISKTDKW